MASAEPPRLYLVTPPAFALADFADDLAGVLDAADIACVRLALATTEEQRIVDAAEALRPVCAARDVALVLGEHYRLARRLGLDGAHLSDGVRHARAARETLGTDAILGVFAGVSRHVGLTAGEIGADYVSFGPLTASTLGDGALAPRELFAWWSEMIEVPVIAEGGLTLDIAAAIAPVVDFLALGAELWSDPEGPRAALARMVDAIS